MRRPFRNDRNVRVQKELDVHFEELNVEAFSSALCSVSLDFIVVGQ